MERGGGVRADLPLAQGIRFFPSTSLFPVPFLISPEQRFIQP